MTFSLMEVHVPIATFILCLYIGHINCAPPDQMPAPTVENVLATSATVVFDSLTDATTYIVTLEPRHRTTGSRDIRDIRLSPYVADAILTECTVYYISIRAVNSEGEEGPAGNKTQFRTARRLSTFHLGSPFSGSVDVFFNSQAAHITQWFLQSRQASSGTIVNTTVDSVFTGRAENLDADTSYEIRVRPMQMSGQQLPESENLYSPWISFKTKPLSIFGRVVLTQTNYSADYGTQYSTEWNETRQLIETAYSGITNHGVNIIRNEDDGSGKVQTHYRLEVTDKTLPSPTNFTLSGGDFANSFINNGGRADGTPFLIPNGRKYTLLYSSASTCSKIVERFMVVTPDDEETFEIHLNVASSSATTPEEDDSLVVNSDGSLVRDDGATIRTVSRGTVLTLTPKFLLKDCLAGGDSVTSLYSEVFEASNLEHTANTSKIVTYTDKPMSVLVAERSSNVTSTFDGKSATVFFPAVEFAQRYELLNQTDMTILATLEEADIDCTDFLKVEVSSLEPNTTYNFTGRVTTLNADSTQSVYSFSINNITTIVATPSVVATPSGAKRSSGPLWFILVVIHTGIAAMFAA